MNKLEMTPEQQLAFDGFIDVMVQRIRRRLEGFRQFHFLRYCGLFLCPEDWRKWYNGIDKSKIDERIGIEKKSTDLMEESVKPL